MDDSFPFHPKTVKAGNAAVGAWTRMLTWCSQQLTDGKLPASLVLICSDNDAAIVERLVKVRLLDETPDGYAIHDYLDYNPSREKVLAEREAWRKRQGLSRRDSARDTHRDSGSPVPVPVPVPQIPPSEVQAPPVKPARRGTPTKPRKPAPDYWRDPAFARLAKPWPAERRGQLDGAFAAWQGAGEAGRARIAKAVTGAAARTGRDFQYAGNLAALIVQVAAEPDRIVPAAAPAATLRCTCGHTWDGGDHTWEYHNHPNGKITNGAGKVLWERGPQ